MKPVLGIRKFHLDLFSRIKERYGSQTSFSRELGMSRTILSGVMNGRINPTMEEVDKMADLLECDPHDLYEF